MIQPLQDCVLPQALAVYFPFQSFHGAGPFLLSRPLNSGVRRNKSMGGVVDGRWELLA